MRREAAAELLPLVEDNEWFFDTEVLVTAQRLGLRIHEVPVDWVDDTDSRVHVVSTALADLRGVVRMLHPSSKRRTVARPTHPTANGPVPEGDPSGVDPADRLTLVTPGGSTAAAGPILEPSPVAGFVDPDRSAVFADELLRFAGVGAVSTVAYVALFAALEPGLGSYLANAVAIVLCSLGNTAAHRGMAGSARLGLDRRHRLGVAAGLMGVSLATTTVALAAVRAIGLDGLLPELIAVATANALAAVARFAILRTWVFRPTFGILGGRPADAVDPAHRPIPTPTDRPG
jgi:putative flippase GtrA